jgi:hypothetical protein
MGAATKQVLNAMTRGAAISIAIRAVVALALNAAWPRQRRAEFAGLQARDVDAGQ